MAYRLFAPHSMEQTARARRLLVNAAGQNGSEDPALGLELLVKSPLLHLILLFPQFSIPFAKMKRPWVA
jgi:hypothetical protein